MDLPETSNEDSDREVENIVVEFEGNFDLNTVKGKQLQIIGVDTEEPILRIDQKFYKLDIKHSIGTRLILGKDSDKKMKYYAKSDKLVKAARVIMKPKDKETRKDEQT